MALDFSRLELDLKAKLAQRVSVRQSPEQYLFKSFKFFDVSDSGSITLQQWMRALEKIGLSRSSAELETWFRHYDEDTDGKVNYRSLCKTLFTPTSLQAKESLTPALKDVGLTVIQQVRRSLSDRGEEAAVALDRQLHTAAATGRLNRTSFSSALREACPGLDARNSDLLYDLASSQGSSYAGIAETLWGGLSQERSELVQIAFAQLDNDGDGFISMRTIRHSYFAKQHPAVKAGARSVDEVYRAFMSSFEAHHRCKGMSGEQVSRQEWEEYYRIISAITVSEPYFEGILKGVWALNEPSTPGSIEVEVDAYGDLPGKPGAKRGRTATTLDLHQSSHLQTGARHRDSTSPARQVDSVLSSLRQKLGRRGVKGVLGLLSQLSLLDTHNSGLISLHDLLTVLRNYRIEFNDHEVTAVFQHFDASKSGAIPYKRLLNAIIGRLSNQRQQAIEDAWTTLADGQSGVDLRRLETAYCAGKHPDVKGRLKTASEAQREFMDSFLYFKKEEKTSREGVSKAEFTSYYEFVSSCYEDDHKFIRMVTSCWQAPEVRHTAKPKLKDRWSADHRFIFGGSSGSTAPFGVSNEPVDWSTSMRPRTGRDYADDRRLAAGHPTKERRALGSFRQEDAGD
jgi:Ca2+-binding EF-hand superfamily protein